MHVLFLAPDTHIYNHGFVRALTGLGVRVSGIGPSARDRLAPAVARELAEYRPCAKLFDVDSLAAAAAECGRSTPIDRVETIDEPLVEAAAGLRERLGLPGLPLRTARLCRDKAQMKAFLRERGIACAASTGAASEREVRDFAARVGLPVILKPIAGFGSLDTYRVADQRELDAALAKLKVGDSRQIAVEEFVEGHEGFFDTIVDGQGVRHEFGAHYFPGCLEAALDRRIAPQIAVTNRIEQRGYRELREMGRKVVDLLGLRHTATHMEWFFGPKGLKFSEIGARPAGEKIWDMYRVGNDFDVYREWALAVLGRPGETAPSRRLAVGSVQIRPDRDGHIVGHVGVERVRARFAGAIYESELPPAGAPTLPLDKGWLVNTWFRLQHPDYDELRRMMTEIGRTVRTHARA